MPEVNSVENLRLWLRQCPAIEHAKRFGVDNMGSKATEYAIFSTPSSMNFKRDILGNVYYASIQEVNYTFASQMDLPLDVLAGLENQGFFTAVMDWIYAQNISKNFPEIAEGQVLMLVPTLSPYIFTMSEHAARYQIQLKITYRRKSDG